MNSELKKLMEQLTPVQRDAVDKVDGAYLILAGPGSGKTRVLTTRAAKLLEENEKIKLLALTFTTKGADEMRSRISAVVPGQEDRVLVGTFHSFCVQVLRQHGVHIGIKSDFSLYSREEERTAILEDELKALGHEELSNYAGSHLKTVDELKKRLLGPDKSSRFTTDGDQAEKVAIVYEIYDQALKKNNALDFNALIFETCKLLKTYPAIAKHYCRTYKYWLLDEFQDTTPAQYFLIKTLAGENQKNIFVVADDDQIIFEWNGASYKQIENYRTDFEPELIQLPTNFRCPSEIVRLANLLVSNNKIRTPDKQPLESGKTKSALPESEHIKLFSFDDNLTEAAWIAEEIAKTDPGDRNEIAVLGRYTNQLELISEILKESGIDSVISKRRDEFLSPHFKFLDASLKQVLYPLDARNFQLLVESFNRATGANIEYKFIVTESESKSKTYLDTWCSEVGKLDMKEETLGLIKHLHTLEQDKNGYREYVKQTVQVLKAVSEENPENYDLIDDMSAWDSLWKEINSALGSGVQLHELTQEMSMRSKEPPLKDGAVSLMTIHSSKGKEFDYVYLVGVSEDILPSYQSRIKGPESKEMEEERRNCFVAITRAKESLVITYTKSFKGHRKEPSRFLLEMGLLERST